jgi:hypothetical protein
MWHAWERRGMCTRFWWEKPGGKRPFERPRHRWEDEIRMDLRETDWGVWIGSSWLRIGTGGSSCEYGDEPPDSDATELVS